ncbi:acyl carrier protein [Actinomadura spongiicola]|uniref:Acyl carrier protein n=1 Tax=Actinomadura spongiicola TaxID=2303421 RepID=A0A372GFZ9_9ACTN|nr:phosphopantetheine-binding protein [Actinomadura spongiicola]RFS84316.1 acyl carrier protein [Actinomadura spongiicola]
MPEHVEVAARRTLAPLLDLDIAPDELDPDRDLAADYGLTSLNKVLFLTSVCEDTGVALSRFTERDVARMHTLRDVTELLSSHAGSSPRAEDDAENEAAR